MREDEQGGIRFALFESNLSSKEGKTIVPCPWCLFKAIEGPLEETNIIWFGLVNKIRRLVHVDSLVKIAMEEGVLDVELVERPVTRGGNTEHGTDGSQFNHGDECLVIIDAKLL